MQHGMAIAWKNLPEKLTAYVNPFIGTNGLGHTFPGATYPSECCS